MGREALTQASRDELIERVIAADAEMQTVRARLAEVEAQLRWFQQQLFGAKSERRLVPADPAQLSLGESLAVPVASPETGTTVRAHVRCPRPKKDEDEEPDSHGEPDMEEP